MGNAKNFDRGQTTSEGSLRLKGPMRRGVTKCRCVFIAGRPGDPQMHRSALCRHSGSYRTHGDILPPLAHVGAVLQCGAAALPGVPAAVGVSCLQTQPTGGRREEGGGR